MDGFGYESNPEPGPDEESETEHSGLDRPLYSPQCLQGQGGYAEDEDMDRSSYESCLESDPESSSEYDQEEEVNAVHHLEARPTSDQWEDDQSSDESGY